MLLLSVIFLLFLVYPCDGVHHAIDGFVGGDEAVDALAAVVEAVMCNAVDVWHVDYRAATRKNRLETVAKFIKSDNPLACQFGGRGKRHLLGNDVEKS